MKEREGARMTEQLMVKETLLVQRRTSRVWTLPTPQPTSQSDLQRFVVAPFDLQATDPFVVLAEDWFSQVGFDWHPHRGFETVTYVIDGELEHKDSTGAHAILQAGDVQWTTMGWTVFHAELAYQRRGVHTLQLWLNTPAAKKRGETRYQNLRAADVPTIVAPGVSVRVYSGRVQGVPGPAEIIWPATVIDGKLAAGSHFRHEVPGEDAAFLYVISGALTVGADGASVKAGQVVWFDAGERGATGIDLVAEEDSYFVAYSAAPIGEPVVARGPFVMNSSEEIAEAFSDYRRGLFGPVPNW